MKHFCLLLNCLNFRDTYKLSLFEKLIDQTSYIGEVGLDFSREGISTKEQQIESFEYVLNKVRGKKKLLSLHSRGAEKATLDLLLKYNVKLAIFHWYTGSASVLREAASHGYYFSINPAMLRSEKVKSLISQIPRQLMLTETDGPFVQCENRIVEPSDMVLVIQYIAKLWGDSEERVKDQIKSNFYSLIENLR